MHVIQHRAPAARRQRGQAMSEYIIIVALVAIAAIAAFTFFGGTLRSQLGGVAQELAGEDGGGAREQAAGKAADVQAEGDKNKSMAAYEADNARAD